MNYGVRVSGLEFKVLVCVDFGMYGLRLRM